MCSLYSRLGACAENKDASRADLFVATAHLCLQTVKMGVQYTLWGGSILNLGTEKHRKKYYEAIDKFKLPGQSCSFDLACRIQMKLL